MAYQCAGFSTPHVPICRKKQVLGALACRHSLGNSNPCESGFLHVQMTPKKTHADLERKKDIKKTRSYFADYP